MTSSGLKHIQYRNEMASLDPNDPELSKKITFINKKYGFTSGHKNRRHYNGNPRLYHLKNIEKSEQPNIPHLDNQTNQHTHTNRPSYTNRSSYTNRPFYMTVPNYSLRPFNEQINNFNNFLSKFQKHFEESSGPLNFDNATDFDPSDAYNKLLNNNDGYTKYVSSFTSFDSTGQKKGATVSGVEKVVNGKRTVSKKIRRFENGVETLEQVFPDGRRTTTTRNIKNTHPLPDKLTQPTKDTTVNV